MKHQRMDRNELLDEYVNAYLSGTLPYSEGSLPSYQYGTVSYGTFGQGPAAKKAFEAQEQKYAAAKPKPKPVAGHTYNINPGMPGHSSGIVSGGVAGGGGAGAGGAGVAQLPYQPGAPKTQALIDPLAKAGKGMLDPESGYSQRLREQMVGGIGQQTQALQRGANLQASRAGFGSGAGAELLETQGDIGRQGLAAQGQAGANLALQAPQVGAQIMNPALSAQLGLQGQGLQAYMGQQQIGAQQQGQKLQAQLQQQQMSQQQQFQQAQMQQQQQQQQAQMDWENQKLQQEMQMRELSYYG